MYSLAQVASLLDTSVENCRRWCLAFEKYLSKDANPGDGRKRLLNDDDLAVFTLAAEMRGRGLLLPDILAALEDGQRGPIPANPSIMVPANETRLARLQADVDRLTEALAKTQGENLALIGQLREAREQREAALEKIDKLNREIGRLGG